MADLEALVLKLAKLYNNDYNNVIFKLADILNKPQEDLVVMVDSVFDKYKNILNKPNEDLNGLVNSVFEKYKIRIVEQILGSAGAEGSWITVNGTPVFIPDGENKETAVKEHFDKQSSDKQSSDKPSINKQEKTKKEITESLHKKYPNMSEKFIDEQMTKADDLRSKHEPILDKNLNDLRKEFPDAEITGRVKTSESMVEKLGRKPDSYKDVSDLKDVSGIRVVGKNMNDVNGITTSIVNGNSNVLENENYLVNDNEGYRSQHLTIQDKQTGFKTEVQIRTQNEDRWANYVHDTAYKVPDDKMDFVKANRGTLNNYNKGMSDYFYKLDTGNANAIKPDCPPQVKELIGCL